MRVLLDECVLRKLKRDLAGHEAVSVTERGWSGVENGNLLSLAQAEFDVFLTVDQNLNYQQNLASFDIAIILLIARNHARKALLPLMPEVRTTLETIKRGDFVRIGVKRA